MYRKNPRNSCPSPRLALLYRATGYSDGVGAKLRTPEQDLDLDHKRETASSHVEFNVIYTWGYPTLGLQGPTNMPRKKVLSQ